MTSRGPDLDPLFEILGHGFSDPQLLAEALTHPSAHARRGIRQSYERLEFLGDRVLGLVVAELLWRRFPDEAEGELTQRHTGLVRRESLVEVARAIGLGRFVILSPGEAQAGARENSSVLADACEAVIAALYLDGGLEAARAFAMATLAPQLGAVHARARGANPKQRFQQLCQSRFAALPNYIVIESRGEAHAKAFLVAAEADGERFPSAWGRTRKEAESWAAHEALLVLSDRGLL
jgi:ribonuclease-3